MIKACIVRQVFPERLHGHRQHGPSATAVDIMVQQVQNLSSKLSGTVWDALGLFGTVWACLGLCDIRICLCFELELSVLP